MVQPKINRVSEWFRNYGTIASVLIMIGGGIVFVTKFYYTQTETTNQLKEINQTLLMIKDQKADKHELEDVDDKINRIYPRLTEFDDKVDKVELKLEHETGYREGYERTH